MTTVEIRRMTTGPSLVIEHAELLARDFFRMDPSSAAGGYDDLAGRGEQDRITKDDITAINATMRARSPHAVWDAVVLLKPPPAWLQSLDPMWDLIAIEEALWQTRARNAVGEALTAMIAPGRGLSVATKVLHLKRPRMFPVLDSLVLQQLGVSESINPIRVIDHLRLEGRGNEEGLRAIQAALRDQYDRSLVRIMDVLLWASHPAAGLAPSLVEWRHVMRHQPTNS